MTQSGVRSMEDLPSPRGLPLLGNALQMNPERMHQILEGWCEEFGDTYTIGLGPKRVLVSSRAELLQVALRERPQHYRRFSPLESIIEEMGWNGVFTAEGPTWRPQRRLVMQALATVNFRNYFPALQSITDRLRRHWQRAAATGQAVEMTQDLVRFTVDATTALAFGEDPNTIDQTGDVIQDHLALVLPMLNARLSAPFPLWRYFKLPRDRRFDRSIEAIHAHIHQLIERTRKRMRDEPAQTPRNLLEGMLTAASEPDSEIDDKLVVANTMTLLLAGEDTTSQMLAWTMPFLCGESPIYARLREVSAQVFGHARVCPEFEDLKKLDLFEATAHEASRMKPTVPLNFHESVTDVVLGDIAVPAGTPLIFVLRPAMLSDKHFGRPEQFLPERWATGHEEVQPHDPRAYAQFGAGPRACPGRQLAGVEMRLVLSMLARNFSLELGCDPQVIKEVNGFTLMPSQMPVRLTAL